MLLSSRLQLVCIATCTSFLHIASGQATSTGVNNGIVSAAGGPAISQTVSYSIEGQGIVAPTPVASASSVHSSHTTGVSSTDNAVMNGSNLTSSSDRGLSIPAILGITAAVLLAVVSIIMITIFAHKKKQLAISRAKRKSIMDAEFAASDPNLLRTRTEMSSFDKPSIGYFDIAKPLPAVLPQPPIEDDRLSRSSTIIADAAEIAQLNRKVSVHQQKAKESREQVRERNHALQILITNAENRTSVLHSPLTSNPTTPVDPETQSPTQAVCTDGDGDAFARRPSKL